MRPKRKMTVMEFEAVRPFLRISEDRIAAARAALVDGRTLQAVGDQFGWSRQAVGDATSVVWRTFESYQESQCAAANAGALPPGWEQVTLIAPSNLIPKFQSEIDKAARRTRKAKGSKTSD